MVSFSRNGWAYDQKPDFETQSKTGINFRTSQTSSDIYEPDDSQNEASPISSGSSQNHTIYPAGDHDWMTFSIANQSEVTIETRVGVDTVIYLYDLNINLLESDDDGGVGLGSFISIQLGTGQYYIEVVGYSSVDIGNYSISLSVSTLIDSYEPDDSSTNATELRFDETQNHTLYPVGDNDWFFFTLIDFRGVTIETTAQSADTYINLYNSSLALILSDDDGGVGLASRIDTFLDIGTYFVEVMGFANSSVGSYTITLRDLDLTDEYEPDDSSNNATMVFGDELQRHSLFPSDDHDWFTFSILEPSTTRISVIPDLPGPDTVVILYDDLFNVITSDDNGGQDNGSYIEIEIDAGTYYFEVRGATSSQQGYYDLSFILYLGTVDPYEPDNDFDNATQLFFSNPQNHSLVPTNDVDYVYFTLQSSSVISMFTSGLDGDTVILLFDNAGNLIAEDDDSGKHLFSSITQFLPVGTYYLRIELYDPNVPIDSYNVSLVTGFSPDSYEEDDYFDAATPIEFWETQNHTISQNDVADFFVFNISRPMEVEISTTGEFGDTVMMIYDENTIFIEEIDDTPTSLFAALTIYLEPGEYYVEVTGYFSFEYSMTISDPNSHPPISSTPPISTTTVTSSTSTTSEPPENTSETPAVNLPLNIVSIITGFMSIGLLVDNKRRKLKEFAK